MDSQQYLQDAQDRALQLGRSLTSLLETERKALVAGLDLFEKQERILRPIMGEEYDARVTGFEQSLVCNAKAIEQATERA